MSDPVAVDADLMRRHPLPVPHGGSKEERGRVAILGGSAEVPGAVLLAGIAALRAGAGKLQIATAESRAAALGAMLPEALVIGLAETESGALRPDAFDSVWRRFQRCDTILAGPGMVEGQESRDLIAALLEAGSGSALVLDAGALDGLRAQGDRLRGRQTSVILTPHAGEMANMLGLERDEVEADPLQIARRVAAEFNAVVVMKGSETFVAEPGRAAWRYRGGSVGLATSGSGDVLAGIIAGLGARGAPPVEACFWGVFLHGEAGARLAGAIGPLGFLAREIAAEVPPIMAAMR